MPWSFEKLFQRHFELRAECGEAPWDDGAYSTEVSRIAKWEQHWRLRLFIEVKNVEIHEILRPLSGLYPSLCFSCAELCLDDGSIVGRLIHRRRISTWEMPDTRQDVHWRAAAKAFDIDDLEEAYEDDVIRYDAESAMFEEALVRWDAKVRVKLQRARTDDRSG